MDQLNQPMNPPDHSDPGGTDPERQKEKRFSFRCFLAALLIAAILASVLTTYFVTSARVRAHYTKKLQEQKAYSDTLEPFGIFEVLRSLNNRYSIFSEKFDEQKMLEAALKAYVDATGDRYAAFYTEEEFAQFNTEISGSFTGLGIRTLNDSVTVGNREYKAFCVVSIYDDSPVKRETGVQPGDYIFAVLVDGVWKNVGDFASYDDALNAIRGEEGTTVSIRTFTTEGDHYKMEEYTVTRAKVVIPTVSSFSDENDPEIGVVRITEFDRNTPRQFRDAVTGLQSSGVRHFVFDVRDNPGGDLQSILSVMTFFLSDGDPVIILTDADEDNEDYVYTAKEYLFGEDSLYHDCSVSAAEIGLFADLDAVVLCNGNTASAAEVFVSCMRDYGLAKAVGTRTFGKGIMQQFLDLSSFSQYRGYLKLTTAAFVTKSGVSYHGEGLEPDLAVTLPEELQSVPLVDLAQSDDTQLQAAFSQFKK